MHISKSNVKKYITSKRQALISFIWDNDTWCLQCEYMHKSKIKMKKHMCLLHHRSPSPHSRCGWQASRFEVCKLQGGGERPSRHRLKLVKLRWTFNFLSQTLLPQIGDCQTSPTFTLTFYAAGILSLRVAFLRSWGAEVQYLRHWPSAAQLWPKPRSAISETHSFKIRTNCVPRHSDI